jgi:hypothetical protein
MAPVAGGGAQAGGLQTPAGLLPPGWEREYALALKRAVKPESLKNFASQFWAAHGGWDKHKNGPDAHTAIGIYDAFANRFHDHEGRNVILRELGAD